MHAKLLGAELQRAGWRVEIVTLESLPAVLRYLPHLVEKAINLVRSPMGFYYKGRTTRFLYRLLLDRNASLRIFEDIYLSWSSLVPSVTLLHAVWSDNLQSISASPNAIARLVKAEEAAIDAIAHPLATVSVAYRDFLVANLRGASRLAEIGVLPLGVDLTDFEGATDNGRAAKSMVYCGSLEVRKNVMFLLRVFRQLHDADGDYRLTLIGNGPESPELEYYAQAHSLPVTFCGRLGRKEVISELRKHSMYVHPSVKESFSFALLEAKLVGLRTIAFEGLEVPAEFIDVPVASFEESDWLMAIRSANQVDVKEVDTESYSSRTMLARTLALVPGAGRDVP
jgi:glycosyltransferase involved in cell wall biosynthesis